MKRTKKFYREQVERSCINALAILPELVKKYGKNPIGRRGRQCIRIPSPSSFWNHYITDFHFSNSKLFANVYWQGPSTDGDSVIQIVPGRTSYRIPAEYFDDGYRTRTVHGDLQIDVTELHEAIKRLVNSL